MIALKAGNDVVLEKGDSVGLVGDGPQETEQLCDVVLQHAQSLL